MKKKNLFQSISVLLMMLVFSMAFIPAVNAEVDLKYQEEMYEKSLENVEILYDSPDEKISLVKTGDDSVLYLIARPDVQDESKTNFAFVKQEDLISKTDFVVTDFKDSKNVKDSKDVVNSLSRAYYEFWDGSYIQTFGNNVTGGFYIYLSPDDAEFVFEDTGNVAGALAALIAYAVPGIGTIAAGAVGALVKYGMKAYYKFGKAADDSITITVLYAMIAAYIAGLPGYIQIGSLKYYWI